MVCFESMMVRMPQVVGGEMLFYLFKDSSFCKFADKYNVCNWSPVFTQSFITFFELWRYFVHLPEAWIDRAVDGDVDQVEEDVLYERSSKLDTVSVNLVDPATSVSFPLL